MGSDRSGCAAWGEEVTVDPDYFYIVTYNGGRISKCGNWFQAYNELATPGAAGSIKHHGIVLVTKSLAGKWEWFLHRSQEPGFDLDVEGGNEIQ